MHGGRRARCASGQQKGGNARCASLRCSLGHALEFVYVFCACDLVK